MSAASALSYGRPGAGGLAHGDGGAVNVNYNGSVQVTGRNAVGIFAQSIGGGGGLGGDSTGAFAGMTGSGGSGSGGSVSVTQSGTIYAVSENSIGIFAQSLGPSGNGQITLDIQGMVIGNANGAGGVVVSGGQYNTMTVASGAYVSGNGGTAVRYQSDSPSSSAAKLDVYNYGTVDGDVVLGNIGTFYNYSYNTLAANYVQGNVVNSGRMVVGRSGLGGTRVTGAFTQTSAGILSFDANFSAGAIDRLRIDGNADLAGRIDIAAVTLAPRRLAFIEIGGTATGTLQGTRRNMFDFIVHRVGNQFEVSVDANFVRSDFGLNAGQTQVAQHLQDIWNAGGGPFGGFFAALANANIGSYGAGLASLRSEAINAPAAENLALTQQRLDRTMSCPVFQGTGLMITQTECVWAQADGQRFNQGVISGASGYSDTVYTLAMGGQKQIAPNWFLGFAAAYEGSTIKDNGARVNIEGKSFSAGVSLKHEIGPWLFAAAASGNFGNFDSNRVATFAGLGGIAQGEQDLSGFGGRLRAAYTLPFQNIYVKPFVDVDFVYTNASGYGEVGGGLLSRQMAGSAEWAVMATPSLEIGTRLDLSSEYVLRGYARAGVTVSSLDNWTTRARLAAAPAGVDGFSVTLPIDDVYGKVGAGLQLINAKNGVNVRAEYDGAFSEHTTRHMGSVRLSIDF